MATSADLARGVPALGQADRLCAILSGDCNAVQKLGRLAARGNGKDDIAIRQGRSKHALKVAVCMRLSGNPETKEPVGTFAGNVGRAAANADERNPPSVRQYRDALLNGFAVKLETRQIEGVDKGAKDLRYELLGLGIRAARPTKILQAHRHALSELDVEVSEALAADGLAEPIHRRDRNIGRFGDFVLRQARCTLQIGEHEIRHPLFTFRKPAIQFPHLRYDVDDLGHGLVARHLPAIRACRRSRPFQPSRRP